MVEIEATDVVGIAMPSYTQDELALLREAADVIQRAWEAGHFSDVAETVALIHPRGIVRRPTLAGLHHAAERAQLLVDERVTVVARSTALGERLLVGIRGRS